MDNRLGSFEHISLLSQSLIFMYGIGSTRVVKQGVMVPTVLGGWLGCKQLLVNIFTRVR
jgi:hypothetical protein